jgi:hypothetical protein
MTSIRFARRLVFAAVGFGLLALPQPVLAGEHLLGYVRAAEPLPDGAQELYFFTTLRNDKGSGSYSATDFKAEYEFGVTDRFTGGVALQGLSIDTEGLLIDGYLPGEKQFGPRFSGIELEAMYNFLQPALAPVGLSIAFGLDYSTLDPHSGQDKDTLSFETGLLLQRYFHDGQGALFANLGLEATYADRAPIANLPDGFDWPTEPEMELEPTLGVGVSYRFARGWSAGAEALYETEFETEVGQERWSWFAGPSLHYGGQRWWATLTYFDQIQGGGEAYADQPDTSLHLIEKTEYEVRLKLAFNF